MALNLGRAFYSFALRPGIFAGRWTVYAWAWRIADLLPMHSMFCTVRMRRNRINFELKVYVSGC